MARPRIAGIDEKIIDSFISRNIYSSQKEVLHQALKALVKEQQMKEASALYTDDTYRLQLQIPAEEDINASMGHLDRQAAVR